MKLSNLLITLILISSLPTPFAAAQTKDESKAGDAFTDLNEELNRRMGSGEMGYFSGRFLFSLDSAGQFHFSLKPEQQRFETSFLKFLHEHKQAFETGRYHVHIYRDRYSNRFYSNLVRYNLPLEYYEEAVINYPARPRSSIDQFLNVVKDDLIKNYDSTKVGPNDWIQPIEVHVYLAEKITGEPWRVEASFINNNGLVRFMDEAKDVLWHVALYNAHPMPAVFSFRMDRERLLNEQVMDAFIYEQEQYTLEEQYKGNLVRFIDSYHTRDLPLSRLGVSFVLKPGVGFVDPVMHYGEIEEIQEFIEWMENRFIDALSHFQLRDRPEAKRYFFFVR